MELSTETSPEIETSETMLEEPTQGEPGFIDQFMDLIPSGSEQARIAREQVVPALTSVATSIPATVAGGVTGLVSAPFVGMEKAGDIVEKTQKALTSAPDTAEGMKGLETVGDLIQGGMDTVNFPISGLAGLADLVSGKTAEEAGETIKSVQEIGLPKTAGNQTLEATGNPLLATVTEMAPSIATSFIPIAKMAQKRSALNDKLAAKIQDSIAKGEPQKSLAKYIVDGSGKVKSDALAAEAIKQGVDQGIVATIKGSTKVDKTKMLKMLEIMRKTKENPKFAMKNRPSDVAGNSLIERVNHIKSVNKTAGSQLDDVAKSLKGKQGNIEPALSGLADDLDGMGITLDRAGKPNFIGSDIEGLAGPEKVIKDILIRMRRIKRGKTTDAHEMHRLKKYIDEQVTYGKSGEGLKGKTENILKKLRKSVDDSLDKDFKEYNTANTTYSDTVDALDSLQDVAGKKMDLFGPNAEKATGTLLRRMMSNAQSRVTLVDAVDKLEAMSKKYGGQFADDISSQMLFADELDNFFGPTARTSLAGETAKGVKKGAEIAKRSSLDAAVELGASGVEKLRGINEENAIKSISELLKRGSQ